jgi:predicted MPP superfamily phosphohydrolase
MWLRILLLAVFYIAITWYAYRGLRLLHPKTSPCILRKLGIYGFLIVDVALILFSLGYAIHIRASGVEDYIQYRRFFLIIGAFMLLLIPKATFAVFVLLHDIMTWKFRIMHRTPWLYARCSKIIGWSERSRWLLFVGLIAASYMFFFTLFGMTHGRYNFQVVEQEVWSDDLPGSFDGFRIVHISDTHLGSFKRTYPVKKGLLIAQSLNPDMVALTGDMVNNHAREAKKFIDIFRVLKPSYGMFSVLGNHDMGDYRTWGTIEKPVPDIEGLVKVQQKMGFVVLLNEHVFISKGNDSIKIVGVKNWGLPPFNQAGDLDLALGEPTEKHFTILLSHDPTHWRQKVIPGPKVHLTLSGHSHGMQFGFSNRLFHWSPIQWKYPEWNGLYSHENEMLHVNRGFGFLSYPGRAGMRPEITLITLRKGTKPIQ